MKTEISTNDNKKTARKLLSLDVIFLAINLLITYLMFHLWFWLFSNKVILTILICGTLLGLMKQTWKAVENIGSHWKLYKI